MARKSVQEAAARAEKARTEAAPEMPPEEPHDPKASPSPSPAATEGSAESTTTTAPEAPGKTRTSRRPISAQLGAAESKLTSFDLRANAAREALKGKLLSIEVERVDFLATLSAPVRALLEAGGLAARQPELPGTES